MASCTPGGLKTRPASGGWWQPALPTRGRQAAGGFMLVRHPPCAGIDAVRPSRDRAPDGLQRPKHGDLVLIDDLEKSHGPHARQVGRVLGLTHADSGVAPWLVESKTVPDIAALSGRAESSIRTHLKSIHREPGVSRRAELVRLGQSEHGRAGCRCRL